MLTNDSVVSTVGVVSAIGAAVVNDSVAIEDNLHYCKLIELIEVLLYNFIMLHWDVMKNKAQHTL